MADDWARVMVLRLRYNTFVLYALGKKLFYDLCLFAFMLSMVKGKNADQNISKKDTAALILVTFAPFSFSQDCMETIPNIAISIIVIMFLFICFLVILLLDRKLLCLRLYLLL